MSAAIALLSDAGLAELARLAGRRALFAFDFDGTLAPIQPRPDEVRIDAALAGQLQRLADRAPVAVVTGRRVEDVRGRIGFVPHAIVGSHGAEDGTDAGAASRWVEALTPLRVRLRSFGVTLGRAGVAVEDKGLSIALHYRGAPEQVTALAAIDRALSPMPPALRRFDGKQVVNLVAAGAPDKAAAVRRLLAAFRSETLFFAGDDLNDEPVFESAVRDWMTVKVGRDAPSKARFMLEGQDQMALAVDRLLALAVPRPPQDPHRSASGV